jgi:hypothetical protein
MKLGWGRAGDRPRRWVAGLVAGALSFAVVRAAHADAPAVEAPSGTAERAAPEEPQPAPYAAAFGLRVPAAATAVRAETAYGLDVLASRTVVEYLTAAYAPTRRLSFFVRGGWVELTPESGPSVSAFTNVALGGQWAGRLSRGWRVAGTLGTGLPVAQGGGSPPDAGAASAIAAGNLARSRLEGSTMFSPNDVAPFVGGDIGWASGGLTVQAEANLFELVRVRGEAVDHDATKTSFMGGVHAGYFVFPQMSVGLEVRDQTFLSTPAAVAAGKTSRSWVTAGGGIRGVVRVGAHAVFKPGVAYFQPVNDPGPTVSAGRYHIAQIDLLVVL